MPGWRADAFAARTAGAALGLALAAPPALADYAPAPPDVIAWVGTSSPDAISAGVAGDLSGHGTQDWAGVVHRVLPKPPPNPRAPDEPEDRIDTLGGWQIVVFLQQPDGGYRLAVQSPPFSWDCGTSRCWMDDMHIARRSVFVQRVWHWHGCFDNVMFQFKARNGGWPLVGVKANSTEDPYPDDGSTDTPSISQLTDWNRITGDAVVTRTVGKHPARVLRLRILEPTIDLADFDDFSPPRHAKLPSICG